MYLFLSKDLSKFAHFRVNFNLVACYSCIFAMSQKDHTVD